MSKLCISSKHIINGATRFFELNDPDDRLGPCKGDDNIELLADSESVCSFYSKKAAKNSRSNFDIKIYSFFIASSEYSLGFLFEGSNCESKLIFSNPKSYKIIF